MLPVDAGTALNLVEQKPLAFMWLGKGLVRLLSLNATHLAQVAAH